MSYKSLESIQLGKDPEFDLLEADYTKFQKDYEYDRYCFTRRFFQLHTLDYLIQVKKLMNTKQQESSQTPISLKVEELPTIRKEDNSIDNTKMLRNCLNSLIEHQQEEELTSYRILSGLVGQNTSQIIFCILLFVIEAACRLLFSILLRMLLGMVSQISEGNNLKICYILAFLTGFIWLLGNIARHNAFYEVPIIVAKARSGLMLLIFSKLSRVSQYTVKNQEVGKIINMMSNDFNIIEQKGPWLFFSLVSPILIIGTIVILLFRLGWPGLICPFVTVILLPLQFWVSNVNGKIMKDINTNQDKRIKITTEIIEGIKFIKLYGWELAFREIIRKIRNMEMSQYVLWSFGKSIERSIAKCTTFWSGLVCFLVMYFTEQGEPLTVANIFSTLEILNTLKLSMLYLGISGGFYFELQVIFERYANILNIKEERMIKVSKADIQYVGMEGKEINQSSYNRKQLEEGVKKGEIKLVNFDGYWKTSQLRQPNLANINLSVKKGEVLGVTGRIGSGKSGLLGVLIDQIPYYSGTIKKSGKIAYVEQQPILFSASIKENIIFGHEYDERKFKQALKDSCLNEDLKMFDNQQNTMVGEKGVTLSGGQKARLTLARALYANADIYLLDDPISAVDSKVAKKIFQNVIEKKRRQKTIILVTHQISYLFKCDKVIIMDNGKIIHNDSPTSLTRQLKELEMSTKDKQKQKNQQKSSPPQMEMMRQDQQKFLEPEKEQIKQKKKQEESVQVTQQSFPKYIFVTNINYFLFPFTIFVFFVAEILNALYIRFLGGFDDLNAGKNHFFGSNAELFWVVLGGIQIVYFILLVIRYFFVYLFVLFSNEKIHDDMVFGLLRSPCSFFDTTPSGQLSNKFSNDLGIIDNTMAFTMVDAIEGPTVALTLLIGVFAIDLLFIVPGVLSVIFLLVFFTYCKDAIVLAKQLYLRLKSPVFGMVNEMISGLIQIRLFDRRGTLLNQFANLVDRLVVGDLCFWNLSRAFGAYISYASIIAMIFGFVLGIYNIQSSDDTLSAETKAGLYGVSVLFLLQINQVLQGFLRQLVSVKSILVSIERVFLITNLKPQRQFENDYDQTLNIDSKSGCWPKKGVITLQNFSLRYRPQLPLVLSNITLKIKDGWKVGIVGRTGAGKSSLIQALFRIVQPEKFSKYAIDCHNALQMGLHTLRQHLSVIPQTPFLFKGSVKSNLDPFEEKTDEQLWNALEHSGLRGKIQSLPEGLYTNIDNISEVFSVGERQLLCLARALLRKNKFLVLDEATSNVDMQTDHFIQRCIHEQFAGTTVITIAHRLNTVADYDHIVVMEKGRIDEAGSPYELIQRKGLFAEMVSYTGRNADLIYRIAKQSFMKKQK